MIFMSDNLHNTEALQWSLVLSPPILLLLVVDPQPGSPESGFFCAPGAGALLEVQVPPYVDHSERSEVQLHEGDVSFPFSP